MAIYRTEAGYKSVRLDGAAQAVLLGSLAGLPSAAGRYEASASTDQPQVDLLIYRGDRPAVISIYGAMTRAEVRARLPEPIAAAYELLHGFTRPEARDWLPDRIEAMLVPYEYAPEESVVWPKGWPGIDDPATRKRGGGQYSIYLPSTDLDALRNLLRTRREKGAVLIDGKKWSVGMRLPFPHEELWMPPKRD